jgi:hypothetical protein
VNWYDILLGARRASHKGTRHITARDLASEVRIPASERSGPEKLASAWLGKFVRWGYAVRSGHIQGEKRWSRTYSLTKYGLERPEPQPRGQNE